MSPVGHAQVWWADLDKVRPVVILTRANVAPRLQRLLAAPVTTTVRGLSTEVRLGPEEGLAEGSVASLDNVQLIPASLLLRRAGVIEPGRWEEFCAAMSRVMAC
ncbi:MAG: type II toxin-antitoxin system PemK/MazF family toxin [Acidimicrobiia bacterium]